MERSEEISAFRTEVTHTRFYIIVECRLVYVFPIDFHLACICVQNGLYPPLQ